MLHNKLNKIKMSQDKIPSLRSLRGESWAPWLDILDNYEEPFMPQEEEKQPASVSLLPRGDIYLFGRYPKMDVRVICQCEKCMKVMLPSAFLSHSQEKHGPDQISLVPFIPPGTSLLKKNKYAHAKNKKKVLPPPVPPPPLFPETRKKYVDTFWCRVTTKQVTPPCSPATTNPATAELPPPILHPVQATKPIATPPSSPASSSTNCGLGNSNGNSNSSNSSNSSSKHKKSKTNYKKIKEYDPDKHCGVIEGHKGPCLRSITCSNHTVHLRKAVPGRSKDFHQLIAELKAAKDREMAKPAPGLSMPLLDIPPISTSSNSSYSRNIHSSYTKIAPLPQISTTTTSTTTTKTNINKISQPLHVKIDSPVIDNSSSQGNIESSTSLMYMPMSPVAVVSPIQFVQFGGPILRVASTQPVLSPPLATQPIVVTIPVHTNNATMYTTHPKPLIMSTCSTRKVGGTFVLQNQRIDRQRSEIQIAANNRRSITNSCSLVNTHHKPNILKNSIRGGNLKVSTVKRQATDKVVNDNKHIRLNDVNGFIIHADVNEASEAPQTNNSIHENVAFVNMK